MLSKAFLFLGVIAACGCNQPASAPNAGSGEPQEVAMTLPEGDVRAGRKAFFDLKCTACHAVPSEADFPPPVSANLGPPIDARVAGRDVSYLARALVSPSHELSLDTAPEVRAHLTGVLSPMGDFSHAMTVRQLIDLHAYVRSMK